MTLPTKNLGEATVEETELQAEIRQAIAELDSGDCITVTVEELERWAATGEPPWPHESTD
jgi:hypothetical protein